jgi:hypothetical protein
VFCKEKTTQRITKKKNIKNTITVHVLKRPLEGMISAVPEQ